MAWENRVCLVRLTESEYLYVVMNRVRNWSISVKLCDWVSKLGYVWNIIFQSEIYRVIILFFFSFPIVLFRPDALLNKDIFVLGRLL